MIDNLNNIKYSKKDLKNFGITFGVIFLLIAIFLYYTNNEAYKLIICLSGVFFSLGIVTPIILKPFYYIWMVFANILGWLMTIIVLSILFYFIITPIGITARIFKKQFLQLSFDNSCDSHWNVPSKKFNYKDNLNQF